MSKLKLFIQLPLIVIILAIILSESNNQVKCNNNTNIISNNINNNSGNNVNNSGNNINNNSLNNINNNSLNNVNNNSGNNLNNSVIYKLPPVSLLTSKMTGRWYAIYATNPNHNFNLDIENLFGTNPPELKLTISGSKKPTYSGYTILDDLNFINITYESGSRISFNILDYDFDRYLLVKVLHKNKVGITLYSRFNDQLVEQLRQLHNAYKKLDQLGLKFNLKSTKQQPKPKQKSKQKPKQRKQQRKGRQQLKQRIPQQKLG
ncbi:myb-like protein I [Oppia nitens]|uniref:myb-like protein I n=1 Tax=Oppia nitens TaxID=1686743 RepID=UPI0023DCA1DD|nr:myb-like protein I [Oppia nitens]